MKYIDFRNKVRKYPFFRSNILGQLTDDQNLLRAQLTKWKKKKLIIQLKKGLYTLAAEDRAINFSPFYLANNLYTPSYISCESALEYYGLIPEGVYSHTSISTKKTQSFNNAFGKFIYQHVKPNIFYGYVEQTDEFGQKFFIASKEKALIDFFYLKTPSLKKISADIFDLSYRLQKLQILDKQKLLTIAKSINKPKLSAIIDLLVIHIEKTT